MALPSTRHMGSMASWGGADDLSNRRRCYGYVRTAVAERHFSHSHAMREFTGQKADLDREANRRASTMLESNENLRDALINQSSHTQQRLAHAHAAS